jgi:hypothetical protein
MIFTTDDDLLVIAKFHPAEWPTLEDPGSEAEMEIREVWTRKPNGQRDRNILWELTPEQYEEIVRQAFKERASA